MATEHSNPSGLCQCGCGERTSIARQTDTKLGWIKGQPIRFIVGHVSKARIRTKGYKSLDGMTGLHVAIAAAALGKPIPTGAEVHHVDGNTLNNDRRNLVICHDRAYHMLLHARARIVKAGGNPDTQKICGGCTRLLMREEFVRQRNGLGYKCRLCRQLFNRAYVRPSQRVDA